MSQKYLAVKNRNGLGASFQKEVTKAEFEELSGRWELVDSESPIEEELSGQEGESEQSVKELEYIFDSSSRASNWLTDEETRRVREYKKSKKKNQKSAKEEWKESIEEETGMSAQEAFEEAKARESGGQFNTEPSDDIDNLKDSLKAGGKNSNWEQVADAIEEKKGGEETESESSELSEEELEKRKAAISAFKNADTSSGAWESIADELEEEIDEPTPEVEQFGDETTIQRYDDRTVVQTEMQELREELNGMAAFEDSSSVEILEDKGDGTLVAELEEDELKEELRNAA